MNEEFWRVRRATTEDVPDMLDLAELKRRAYADNAYPFHRPAVRAREVQEPFFAQLIQDAEYLCLVSEGPAEIHGFLIGKVGRMPPPFLEEGFHVDDFWVASADLWPTAGRALLGEACRHSERGRIVVVVGPADAPKRRLLQDAGLDVEAEWWVKTDLPAVDAADLPSDINAVIIQAPPVYDPGGPIALTLHVPASEALGALEVWASASQAALVVLPVLKDEIPGAELTERGYVIASEWYARPAEGDKAS